jgi:hypothetical protein
MKSLNGAAMPAPRGARAAALVLASILATLGLTGCGGGKSEQRFTTTDDDGIITAAPPVAAPAIAVAAQNASLGGEPEAVPADSLPPDVAALAADSLASPGESVEVAARTTPDVIEVSLWDGIGRRQSFAYDSTAGLWRGRYRVPLGVQGDRLGLAVIAKNGLGLRHRVWVFLRIERGDPGGSPDTKLETGVAPASGS